ncbi:hypothetical protein A2U01_0071008 [Trifolium medium]|uniref:Uncharacterized protein n=1 Tax=Trifolium medium TaxID=97028 RepID=A0A392SNJ7_9FABA|nr:hypothetical protein [Trifolium medium]
MGGDVTSPSLVVLEHWPIVSPELPRTPQQVVCGVSLSFGPGALAHYFSRAPPDSPNKWYQSRGSTLWGSGSGS